MAEGSSVRITSLLWADVLVGYAFFVMQNYLTDVWGLSFTHSAAIVNIWGGACLILPVFFLFFVDTFLGHFIMLVLSSVAYCVGIAFVAVSTPPVLGTCKQYESKCIGETQKILFYVGMPLVAVGAAGHQVSLLPFLEEQNNKLEGKSLLKILGHILVVIIPIVGAIALPHIKPWTIRFGIPAICTAFTTLLFIVCSCSYIKKKPQGSPITNVLRVFFALSRKMFVRVPLDARKLYKKDDNESFTHTRFLRCLEKAAIDEDPEVQEKNRWKVCSVAEVEEAKIGVRMIPMWLTFIICGIVSSTGNTYFVEQANHMNRKLGAWNVPAPMLLLFYNSTKGVFEKLFVRRLLAKSKKYAAPVGIALAMIFSILCCITAARFETRRLNVMRSHGLSNKDVKEIPMSVFWLLFQYFLLAGLDSFLVKSVVQFYAYQSPESMKNYLLYFTKGVSGLGFMASVLSVYAVGRVKTNWFKFTLNRSHLDKYYWFLAALSSVNLVVFMLVASLYRYKNIEAKDEAGIDGGQPIDDGDGCACF